MLDSRFLHWSTKYPGIRYLVGGDFNIALKASCDRWPPSTNNSSAFPLLMFMQKFNLVDIWRVKNPNVKVYTWSNKSCSSMSRIDYWLVSNTFNTNNITSNILPTPLSGHKAVSLQISFNSNSSRPPRSSYWKLNNSLLKHDVVTKKIRTLISLFYKKALIDSCFSKNWELFKYEVSKYLRQYGSTLSKLRTAEETDVITRISALTQIKPEDMSETDIQDLHLQQNKLNELYRNRAEGAFVRSRRQWLEEGEQNSAYFFQLEKHRKKQIQFN